MIKDYKGKVSKIQNGKISTESIHPEIGELREKFMWKDLAVFKKYKISNFLRSPYEDELETYEKKIILKSCQGEECVAMNCFRISSDTRAIIPINFEMFELAAVDDKTPIYYQKQLFRQVNFVKDFKNNSNKGFKK